MLAALLTACYFLVGMGLSFQHADCLSAEIEAALRLPAPGIASVRLPLKTRVAAAPVSAHKPHACAACEWQAGNVGLPVPILTLFFAPPTRMRVITTFPRYLRVRPIATSSRAPPIA